MKWLQGPLLSPLCPQAVADLLAQVREVGPFIGLFVV
jgi:hypothetical protein